MIVEVSPCACVSACEKHFIMGYVQLTYGKRLMVFSFFNGH